MSLNRTIQFFKRHKYDKMEKLLGNETEPVNIYLRKLLLLEGFFYLCEYVIYINKIFFASWNSIN